MLHILLMILKVIGIILLAIVCLILLIIGVVLMTPIRYEALGKGKKDLSSLKGKLTVTYLLKLVQIDVMFSDLILKWRVRIAWKKMMGGRSYSKEKEKTQENQEETTVGFAIEEMKEEDLDALLDAELAKQKDDAIREETSGQQEKVAVSSDDLQSDSGDDVHLERTDAGDTGKDDCADGTDEIKLENKANEPVEEEPKIEFKQASEKKRKKETATGSKPDFEERIEKGVHKIKCTSKKIYDKITKLQEDASDIYELATDHVHLKALLKVKKLVLKLLKKLIPKHISGQGTIGFDNPTVTGIVMAIYSIFYPYLDGNVDLKADFEQFIVNGKLAVKGKLRLMSFVMLLLGIVVDINCWKTFFHVKHYLDEKNEDEKIDDAA